MTSQLDPLDVLTTSLATLQYAIRSGDRKLASAAASHVQQNLWAVDTVTDPREIEYTGTEWPAVPAEVGADEYVWYDSTGYLDAPPPPGRPNSGWESVVRE